MFTVKWDIFFFLRYIYSPLAISLSHEVCALESKFLQVFLLQLLMWLMQFVMKSNRITYKVADAFYVIQE